MYKKIKCYEHKDTNKKNKCLQDVHDDFKIFLILCMKKYKIN